jgi:hypothetical protein
MKTGRPHALENRLHFVEQEEASEKFNKKRGMVLKIRLQIIILKYGSK